jgi:5-(carboxyamino)imidazole ribonucleotide mutase
VAAPTSLVRGPLVDGDPGEMRAEPVGRKSRHAVQRSRLLEQVRRARHDLEGALAAHPIRRAPVHPEHDIVASADDEQRGRPYGGQVISGQIRSAATGHDRTDAPIQTSGCHQGGGGAGARPEEADGEAAQLRLPVQPRHGTDEPICQQADVEAELAGSDVDGLLLLGEKVEEHRAELVALEPPGHATVAWAVAAAAAAVREHDDGGGPLRYGEVGVDRDPVDRDLDGSSLHQPWWYPRPVPANPLAREPGWWRRPLEAPGYTRDAMGEPQVGVIMGSRSDWETMKHCCDTLEDLGVRFESKVVSAHRTPELMVEYAKTAAERGLKVIVAGAGGAAHLPGMTAANTHLPVLGVPIESKALKGMDSLLSIVQMPAGVPVGSLAIGVSGAVNAGLLAAQIVALEDELVREQLLKFREVQTENVIAHPDPDER